jgi:5-methylcytosine-specific restriction endonuclease McrA
MKGRDKTKLQKMARRRVPRGRRGSLPDLFRFAAEHLGATWTGDKLTGYRLLERFIKEAPILKADKKVLSPPTLRSSNDVASVAFLESYEWRKLRMVVLKKRGARCECCGHTAKDGVKIHVDHIKPRKHHPELALEESNLQILCEVCNHGKGNWDDTDWRNHLQPDRYEPIWSKRVN